MNSKKKLLVLALVLVAVVAAASVLYTRLGAEATPSVLAPTAEPTADTAEPTPEPERFLAPDVTVYDEEGNPIQLSDYRGKPLIISFWATWCPYCLRDMPNFQAKYDELGDSVQFLMINATDGYRETVSGAAGFIEEEGYTFPVVYDTSLNASVAYAASSLPITYFIDAEGYLVAGYRGGLTAENLQIGIDMLLSEAPVA